MLEKVSTMCSQWNTWASVKMKEFLRVIDREEVNKYSQ